MLTAITRIPSASMPQCELAFLERQPIDVDRARRQHAAYRDALAAAGAEVVVLPAMDELPDATFVEDTAIVLPEMAIVAPLGALSRREESPSIAAVLADYRDVRRLEPPATLDGGDVMVLDRTLYVGHTPRTNADAIRQLQALLAPCGYSVVAVPVTKCLHLKSACTALDPDAVLVNPDWVEPATFGKARIVAVAPDEPGAANVVRAGTATLAFASAPHTRALLDAQGWKTVSIDASEMQKAEGALTCLSLLID